MPVHFHPSHPHVYDGSEVQGIVQSCRDVRAPAETSHPPAQKTQKTSETTFPYLEPALHLYYPQSARVYKSRDPSGKVRGGSFRTSPSQTVTVALQFISATFFTSCVPWFLHKLYCIARKSLLNRRASLLKHLPQR